MKHLAQFELAALRVTLFTKGEAADPWIKLTFIGTDGEETEVETLLDCKTFLVRFSPMDEETNKKPLS